MLDRPRLFKDEQQIQLRRGELGQPHIQPLTDFAQSLRDEGYGVVPDFDPRDGGIAAKALFLFEKPGPKAAESGFISRNNNDGTAANTFHLMIQADIPREQTCIWNVVPGWNGTIDLAGDELTRGSLALNRLFELLQNPKVIVLVGKRAQAVWHKLPDRPRLPIIESAHPSPKVKARYPALWGAIADQWARVHDFI
jgi:Uracil DNA glycosylase superfamily